MKQILRSPYVLLLTALVICCFLIIGYRAWRFHSTGYFFLFWNLFLAGIPFAISLILRWFKHISFPAILLTGIWLLFLPNAPYLLTDVIHVSPNPTAPVWYDLFLVLVFALTGLLFGVLSLVNMKNVLQRRFSALTSSILLIGACFLSGFGVYLGRFLRWNSWDILHNPGDLFYDVLHRLVFPADHPRTYFVTLSIGVIMAVLFLLFSVKDHNGSIITSRIKNP